ncbi:MAG: MMPL family transporter [Candidatus Altiarchaeota archaeon]
MPSTTSNRCPPNGTNNSLFSRAVRSYAHFIACHPFLMLAFVLAITIGAIYLQSLLKIVNTSNRDMLPEGEPSVAVLKKIGDEFSGLSTLTFAVETEPTTPGSNEVVNVLDPRVLEYTWLIHRKIATVKEVRSVTSAASLLRAGNGGTSPKSLDRASELIESNPTLAQYVSLDRSLLTIRADLESFPEDDNERVYNTFKQILEETDPPPGTRTFMSGELPSNIEVSSQIGASMAKTSQISLIGILIVVVVVMGSIRYGILPLFTIIFGTIWSFGLVYLAGFNLTSMTSGASSMIMGIGIDFGIQTVSRFRQELKAWGSPERALIETFDGVVFPMSTTTIAALIGFRAMSMGKLTFLAEMATIMSLGVAACMMAAVTAIPAVLIINEKYLTKKKLNGGIKDECTCK